jgi:hypothetical protein
MPLKRTPKCGKGHADVQRRSVRPADDAPAPGIAAGGNIATVDSVAECYTLWA